MMNHLRWMGHSLTILDIQKNLRDDPESCEVTLVAGDHSVRAHRFMLSSSSDLLRALLADIPLGEDTTILIPDIKGYLLDSVHSFIYMGETNISSANLSDFLEAINVLGIKSAISFECNSATLTAATTTSPVKQLSEIQLVQEELIEQDGIVTQKIEEHHAMSEQQTSTRDLEFLDVYNEPQQKITYSLEGLAGSSTNTNEYILTESSGTFTLTQNAKLESASSTVSDKIEEVDDDVDDSNMIEEYSSGADPIIELDERTAATSPTTTTTTSVTVLPLVKSNIKNIKFKTDENLTELDTTFELQQSINTKVGNSGDPISYTTFPNNNVHEGSLDLAVQSVLNEGMSLQKAAHKFDVSKTVLWRRVRKHPNYMKTSRESPMLTLAYERLKHGDSLKNISRDLDIPMSTLHRHKVRLAQQGRLPGLIFKKRDSKAKDELREKLAKAVQACVHEGMSQNHAAILYDIPKSTLWRHLQKRVAEAEMMENLDIKGDEIKEEIILS